ncbi:hypothetical protein ACQEVG_31295 [Streptomyces sp. CA-135486]|uniref:hypothetical protein n=1 Tax=Streptomyces sp. CA-135486 TaxID=3240049 RepID=UPI003D8A5EB6
MSNSSERQNGNGSRSYGRKSGTNSSDATVRTSMFRPGALVRRPTLRRIALHRITRHRRDRDRPHVFSGNGNGNGNESAASQS